MSIINQLSDAVMDSNDYDIVKNSVIALYNKSKPELFDSLMSKTKIMCTKPSVFLNEIRKIGSQLNVTDDFLKVKFIKSLPDNIRPSVLTHNSDSLEELAKVADTLLEYQSSSSTSSVCAVNKITNRNSMPRNNNNFTNVNPSPGHVHNSNGKSFSDPTIPIPVRSFHANQKPKVCRFHLYYGSKAKYCKPWCLMASNSSAQILPNSRPSSRSNSPSRDNSEN